MIMHIQPAVYILSNAHNNILYVGVTADLNGRVNEHRAECYPGSFSSQYNIFKLVYYEFFQDMRQAIAREKEIKKWRREKKNRLINSVNPYWKDLFEDEEPGI